MQIARRKEVASVCAQWPDFNLEVMEEEKSILVFGTVPPVEEENEIVCQVVDDGNKLVITAKGHKKEVQLPLPVDVEETQAAYTHGLFSVTLQKV